MRFVGEQIGKGRRLRSVTAKMRMVAEGVETVRSIRRLARKYRLDMPITTQVYLMLYRHKNPLQAVKDLMSRPLKAE